MYDQDLHTHSLFDDGKASLRDIADAAVEAGLSSLGFSGHSPLDGETWPIAEDRLPEYFRESRALQEEYKGKLSIFCGLEWDVQSQLPAFQTDYLIGSVHRLRNEKGCVNVDHTAQILADGIDLLFAGDREAAEDAYYASYGALLGNSRVPIVGHFDLMTKFDEDHAVFRKAPASALSMMEQLVSDGKIFEVNTGAISRGYRRTPYPSHDLMCALGEMKGKVTLSSDSHRPETLTFGFEDAIRRLKDCGFREIWILTEHGFRPEAL